MIRRTILSGMLMITLALGGSVAIAQESTPITDDATPEASPVDGVAGISDVPIYDADGNEVGLVDMQGTVEGHGMWITITSTTPTTMSNSQLGVHVHETGVCDAAGGFESAGGHFNPTGEVHGDLNADPSHAGDLGNLEVDADGNFNHEVMAEKLTLEEGLPNTLFDADGSALIIHDGEDDLQTDPSGDSGNRWACAVLVPPIDGTATPVGSDETMPDATPVG